MPETLDDVDATLEYLHARRHHEATLLVVPGRVWDDRAVDRLRGYARRGHVLAGHGWLHRAGRVHGLGHYLHSRLFSRDAAEHLALDAPGIAALIRRCHAWFGENGLPAPERYVPPAWAMGRIRRAALASLPFRRYESLLGTFDVEAGSFSTQALVGFEADTRARVPALRCWNRLNRALSRRLGVLRIALHPRDIRLPMRTDIDELLTGPGDGG